MNLNTLAHGEPWMTPEEQHLNRDLIREFTQLLESSGVTESPFTALRVNDIIVTWLLARRLELALAPAEGEPPPCPSPTQAGAIGKCRERLRKAMKDLEKECTTAESPTPLNFVDQFHEIDKKVRATGLVGDGPFYDWSTGGTHGTEYADPEAPGSPIPASSRQRAAAPCETQPGKTAPRDNTATGTLPAETTPPDSYADIRPHTTRANAGKNHTNQTARATPCTLPPEVFELPGRGAVSTPLPSLQRPWDPG